MGKGCQKAYPKRTDLRKKCNDEGHDKGVKDSISEGKDAVEASSHYAMPKKCRTVRTNYSDKVKSTSAAFSKEGATKRVRKMAWTLDNGRSGRGLAKCAEKHAK